MGAWLAPMPSRKRPGNLDSRSATAAPTSTGAPVHMLTIPLATATRVVESRSCPKMGESPGSKPPDDHNAPYPRDSSSAAASSVGSPSTCHDPLHHTPIRPTSMTSRYSSEELIGVVNFRSGAPRHPPHRPDWRRTVNDLSTARPRHY